LTTHSEFADSEQLIAFDSEGAETPVSPAREPWRVLVVDDDRDVHKATVYAIDDRIIVGRPIEFLHAYSAAQARDIIARESNIAFILLDVVMESATAGLDLIAYIRKGAGLLHTRIVLRTGQPGYAPELQTILHYDINDYKSKSELNQLKLVTLFTTTLRAYQQLCAIEANKQGLALIVKASGSFMQMRDLNDFAAGVITQLAALLETAPEGVVCVQTERATQNFRIAAAAGRYAQHVQQSLEQLPQPLLRQRVMHAFAQCRSEFASEYIVLYFGSKDGLDMAVYLDTQYASEPVDLEMLHVFCTNLSACLHNQSLVEKLRDQAYVDELLKLPNRIRLIDEIDARLGTGTDDLALALVDLDDFTSVNELMGHHYGDALLRALAQRFAQVVGDDVMLARVSGDAFGLLGSRERVNAETIQTLMRAPLLVEDRPHRCTFTCGFVDVGKERSSGADALKNATIALKQAKRHARGQHVVYTPNIGEMARHRAQLLADLHKAFDLQHLFLMYQPQIDLASGELIGLEALMRWRREDGSLVAPDQFIPVAEQSGLIVQLGAWALHVACRSMQELIRLKLAPLRMAVNVSQEQFKSADFLDVVESTLRDSGLSGSRLELEITESVAMLGSDLVKQQLDKLRDLDITVSIDDFGTGYSSLSYLEQLPLDRMKIDKAFVRQLGDSSSARIAEMVAELGATLGLRVLAEGIEDRASWDRLQQIGCHEGQGYFIARPLELARLIPWIEEHLAARANAAPGA